MEDLFKLEKSKMKYYLLILISLGLFTELKSSVILGNEKLLFQNFDLIENKRVGVIANHTSVLKNGVHIIDFLVQSKRVNVVAAFGPEHGFRGDAPAGEKVETTIDQKTGIPLYSLYGKINKPTKEMLKDIDVLIYDIQDVGARFYTYISTLYLCMEAASENNIKLIVCDRPNPIGGLFVDGPVVKKEFESFVGIAPLPIQHGMTIGELALYFNDILKEKIGKKCDLTVIQMDNWHRNMFFDKTGLEWIKPSPNIVDLNTAIVYPGTCLIEATNVSEGRGTKSPFLIIGAPFIKSHELIEELKKLNFVSIGFDPIEFTPIDIEGMSRNPKYKNEKCNGVFIQVTDRENFHPVKFGLALITILKKLYPDKFIINVKRMNLLVGDDVITSLLNNASDYKEIIQTYQKELEQFKQLREKYLIYD